MSDVSEDTDTTPLEDIVRLVQKTRSLVKLLDDDDKYHGGLVRVETLKAMNELRLELSRWPK